MAIEFKAPLSKLEEERLNKNIKEISSLMDKTSIIMKSEIELLQKKNINEPNMNQMIFLVASYANMQESLKKFMNVLIPGVK